MLLKLFYIKAVKLIINILKDILIYYIILVNMLNDFKNKFKQVYNNNLQWIIIIKSIFKKSQGKTNKNKIKFFKWRDLIYYKNNENN